MAAYPVLRTKLHIPPIRPELVSRPRLMERLNASLPRHGDGFARKLTLVSAPAGFGKTTLVSEWVQGMGRAALPTAVAWLSLDERDNDLVRFLAYLVASLQTDAPDVVVGLLAALQSPQPPSAEWVLTALLNETAAISERFILVLDDYHVIDSKAVDGALTFLLDHLPPQMHLVITTRENPPLPLARYRAQGQLTEVRAADLRFTFAEAAEFLNRVMGLDVSADEVTTLEARTEGWIAGLHLAALSMRGHRDTAVFIRSFAGSHRFVLDYLVEEVLHQQPERVQTFLLRTSILDRLCGPLCDAVLGNPAGTGQETLEYLERANLFIVPLDDERRWYRYHHLFAGFLRQRLQQQLRQSAATSPGDRGLDAAELHIRASQWYEENNLAIQAFHHAAAANDVERAERLIGGERIPQHMRGAVTVILDWLASLPNVVLDARPWLWWRYASLLLVSGQTTGVEEKLQAAAAAVAKATKTRAVIAEPAPQAIELDAKARNLVGLIASARATLALTRYDPEAMLTQARRALEYLQPDSLISRASANWTVGHAHLLRGERGAACQAFTAAISISQAAGDAFTTILATIGLGNVQERENQLHLAAEAYRRVLQLAGDQPLQIIGEAHLGLARVLYQWNDLDGAEQHGEQGLVLARQYESVIDRFISCEVFLARLKLAQGDVAGAATMLARADRSVRQHGFVHRTQEVAAARVLAFIHQGNLAAAAHLAASHELPISQARVHLARKDASAALAVLGPVRQQAEAKEWADEKLEVTILQAMACHMLGQNDEAARLLDEALAMAQPGGFVRIFVDEGAPLEQLLYQAAARGVMPEYAGKLLAAFDAEKQGSADETPQPAPASLQPLVEPLSPRELEVLQLIAQGLPNREIGERLFIALNTVKGHNRRIYGKLGVKSRTQAINKARALDILPPQ